MQSYGPEVVSLTLLGLGHPDNHTPVRGAAIVRPVLDALVFPQLHTLGDHHHHRDLLFPHHPPEVRHRLLRRPWKDRHDGDVTKQP